MKSEERYKHIEDKIKMAAEGSQYPYTEAAWERMELLLDQKKDKKRPFFWLWPLAIMGVLFAGYLFLNKKSNDEKSILLLSANKVNDGILINTIKNEKNVDKTILVNKTNSLNNISNTSIVSGSNNLMNSSIKKNALPVAKRLQNVLLGKQKTDKDIEQDDDTFLKHKKNYKKPIKTSIKINDGEIVYDKEVAGEDFVAVKSDASTAENLIIEKTISKVALEKPNEIILTENTKEKKDTVLNSLVEKKQNKNKERKKHNVLSSFYGVVTIGAEANKTKLLSFNNTTITPNYGLDLGYQINKRLSVQAGFHASAKKYIASPNDYIVKEGSYFSTVKIIEVDANCLVYQIPITLQYNWLLKKSFSLYGAAGISSYFMKNEDYNYTFDNYYGRYSIPYSHNGNKHLFAVANLSVGIEKRINNKFHLQAVPIISIPFKGIGYGTVKLFSTSFNIGIKYFPFKK